MIPYGMGDSPAERKKFTFVNDSLPMLSISCVKCDKYVTHFIRRGVIRLSSGGCQYRLWYGALYFPGYKFPGRGYPPISTKQEIYFTQLKIERVLSLG